MCDLVEVARLFGASPAVLCDTLVVVTCLLAVTFQSRFRNTYIAAKSPASGLHSHPAVLCNPVNVVI